MDEHEAIGLARAYFLDEAGRYGCAETTFLVLKAAFGLDDPTDVSAAMALNGGIAYAGATCGAITGAALAVGMLVGRRIDDHPTAKRVARLLVADTMEAFAAAHGALDCRSLVGYDLRAPGGHAAFMASGVWRTRCMAQIETVLERLVPLADPAIWAARIESIDDGPGSDAR